VYSEGATRDVKASYAFKIYDFDGDEYIGREDLRITTKLLVGEKSLSSAQIDEVVTQIFDEADLDTDERLSFVEFEHIVARAPDFVNTFRIRL
jgi:calcium and integrin-binding protein 1